VVGHGDVVYHLGDFCLGDIHTAIPYFSRLNGTMKILSIPWHHDRRWLDGFMNHASVLDVHFLSAEAMVKIGEQYVHLSHYPLREWDMKYYNSFHLHGHCHGNRQGGDDDLILDVGVDTHDFYPWSWDEIVEAMGR
jgi:calcineurin-like phosphoesterase family protein